MYSLLDAGSGKLPKILRKKFNGVVSAEALVYFQTSLGYEPDIVSALLNIEIEPFMAEYDALMKVHQSKSGKFNKESK